MNKFFAVLIGGAVLSGCMSLDERLASSDIQVRHAAEAELWSLARTSEEQMAAVKRMGNPDCLSQIALTSDSPVALAAFNKVKTDQYPILAAKARSHSVRKAALAKISDAEGIVYVFSNSNDEAVKNGALEKISSAEVLEKLYAAESQDAWRKRILQRLPAESFTRLHSPDFAQRWRQIDDERTLAKIVRDGCGQMSNADLAEIMAKIKDEKLLERLCAQSKAEMEEMRCLSSEIASLSRKIKNSGSGTSRHALQSVKTKKARLAELKETVLYVGDRNLLRVVNRIGQSKVRRAFQVRILSQLTKDDLRDLGPEAGWRRDSECQLLKKVVDELLEDVADENVLHELARTARSFTIRYAAIEKIQTPSMLVQLINAPFDHCPLNPKYDGWHPTIDEISADSAKSVRELKMLALSKINDVAALRKFFDASEDVTLRKATAERLHGLGAMNADALIAYDRYDQCLFLMLGYLKDSREVERVATQAKLKGTRLCAAQKLEADKFLAIAKKESARIATQCPKGHLEIGGIYLGMDIADAYAVIAAHYPDVKPVLEWPLEGKHQYPYVTEKDDFFLLKANPKDFCVNKVVFVSGMVRKVADFNQGNGSLEDMMKAVERKYGIVFGEDRLEDTRERVGVLETVEGETLQYRMEDGSLQLEYARNAVKGRFGNKGRSVKSGK